MAKEFIDLAIEVNTKAEIKLVLMYLAIKSNSSGLAKVALEDIAHDTSLPKASAFSALRKLESRQIITQHNDGSGQYYNLTKMRDYVEMRKKRTATLKIVKS